MPANIWIGRREWYILPLILAACGGGSGTPGLTVRDSAGVQIIESAGPAWGNQPGWRLSGEPQVSIGRVEGQPEYLFSQISSAVRLSDGRVVVADAGYERAIRYFAPDGTFQKAVGSRGKGPEEYLHIEHIQRLPGDTVVVIDGGQRRLSLLDAKGDWVRSIQYGQQGSAPPAALTRLPDGRWVGFLSSFAAPTEGIMRAQTAVVVLGIDGAGVDTIGTFPGVEIAHTGIGDRLVTGIVPFGHAFAVTTRAAEIYVGTGDILGFDVYSGAGRRLRSVRAPTPDLTFTDDDFAQFRSSMLEGLPNEQARTIVDRYLTNVARPERKPAYHRLLVDPEGNVWLGPYETPFHIFGPWLVFAASGQYLGEVAVPAGLHVLDVGNDYVLGQWHDDMGVESIRVYGLNKSAETSAGPEGASERP